MPDRDLAEQVRARARVTGRVQGVFFRQSCAERARALSVGGWVKNLDDGSVEIVAQGRPDPVRRLLSWAERGPAAAKVSGVEVTWEAADRAESRFAVL